AVPVSKKFLISHMGSFYEERNPKIFLEVVADLVAENRDFARDIEIEFLGISDPATYNLVKRSPIQDKIAMIGYVPHNECLERFFRSQVLLFITDPVECRMHLAGKIFEYLAAGRPILALTGPGEAGDIIKRTRSGLVVLANDAGAIREALLGLYRDYRNGFQEFKPDLDQIRQFERQSLTRRLADLLDEANRG
ncbi:MAG TPA: glycosyltransferase, partial [Actinobacteria bacterium]|nr:glycosyltransferase [Actinomycetota bacterium]